MFWRERSSLPYKLYGQDQIGVASLHGPLGGIMAGLSAFTRLREGLGPFCLPSRASGRDWVRFVCFTGLWARLGRGCLPSRASGRDYGGVVCLADRQGLVRA